MDYTDYIPPVIAKNPKASIAIILSTAYVSLRFLRYVLGRMYLNSGVTLRRNEQMLNFWNVLKNFNQQSAERADEIASWPYPILKEKLQNGSISCVEVLRAYQRKATAAAAATNCVCLFIEEAMNRALELDNKAHDPNYQKPPLFGIPVSIKECIAYKGMDCTLGYVQDMSIPVKEHSAIVKQLLHLGAIPFVRTNNPLSLLTYGCTNAIYGLTCHPKDKNRVPGGSSGGEAALLSLGGSILGIGSDIGGSIRIPSTFCGLAGFKPTVDRFSHINNPGGIPGRVKIIANEGPMATHIDICIDYLKHVWNPEDLFLSSLDPYVPPVPWNEKLFSSEEPLTIGYYTYDGFFTAAPAYTRAVEECAKRLESMGHKLVPIEIPKADKAFQVLLAAVLVDGGIFLNKKLDNDIVPSDCDYGFISRRMPIWAQRMLRPLIPWPRLRNMLGCLPRTPEEIRKEFPWKVGTTVNADIDTYRREFLQLIQRVKVDCLLCPPMCMYPPAHDIPVKIPGTTYTSLFNVLDFPAGTVPVTTVTEEDEKALADYPENDPFDREIKRQCKDCVGYPIGVQIAAPPYREEVALRVLKLIQDSN